MLIADTLFQYFRAIYPTYLLGRASISPGYVTSLGRTERAKPAKRCDGKGNSASAPLFPLSQRKQAQPAVEPLSLIHI